MSLKARVADLVGPDLARAAEAREAVVAAGPAAVPLLLDALKKAVPGSAERKRIVAAGSAIAEHHAEGVKVLRAASTDAADGDAAVALALTARPEAVRLALRAPHFAEAVAGMAHSPGEGRLETVIEAFVDSWAHVKMDVRDARKHARGDFARFLREVETRATTGKPTGWPKKRGPIGTGPSSYDPDALEDMLDSTKPID